MGQCFSLCTKSSEDSQSTEMNAVYRATQEIDEEVSTSFENADVEEIGEQASLGHPIEHHPDFMAEFAATKQGRDAAAEEVVKSPVGTFVLHRSVKHQGEYSLTVNLGPKSKKQFKKFTRISVSHKTNRIRWDKKKFTSLESLLENISSSKDITIAQSLNVMRDIQDYFDPDAIDGDDLYDRMLEQLPGIPNESEIVVVVPDENNLGELKIVYMEKEKLVLLAKIKYDRAMALFEIQKPEHNFISSRLSDCLQQAFPNSISLLELEESEESE